MQHIIRLSTTLILLLIALSCTGNIQWRQSIDWPDYPTEQLPSADQFPGAGAVVLLDEGFMDFRGAAGSGDSEYTRHTIIKIFNENGFIHSNITVPYNHSNKITGLEARTVLKDGRIVVLDKKNIFDITLFPSFIFYSDQRAKRFSLPAVEEDCIIEYKYKIRTDQHTLLHSWGFQNSIPTLISRFKLRFPDGYKIKTKLLNDTGIVFSADSTDFLKTSYTWEAKQLAASEREIAMPSANDLQTALIFQPVGFEDWSGVAQWYHSLSAPRMEPTAKIKALAESIINPEDPEIKKLKSIFEWVRDHIRYVAVEIGIGGFQPHPAEEVLINRYGDCKDMTTLLCALAKSVDLPVSQALISTKPNGSMDTTIASPFQFNHVIAFAPGYADSGLWLDATKKGIPFPHTPWYNRNTLAFVIDDSGNGQFKQTPASKPKAHFHRLDWRVDCAQDLSAEVHGTSEFSDAIAGEIRQLFHHADSSTQRDWLEAYLTLRTPEAELISWSFAGLEPMEDPLKIAYHFKSKSLIRKENDIYYMQPGKILVSEIPAVFYNSERHTPVTFRFGFLKQCSLKFSFVKPVQILNRKLSELVTSGFGYYSDKFSMEDRSLIFRSNFAIEQPEIAPEDYPAFRNFLRDVQTAEDRVILFRAVD